MVCRNGASAWERCRYETWLFTVLDDFFKTHFTNVRAAKATKVQSYGVPQPADKYQINYIMSLYGTLKRFIRDYQTFARSFIFGRPPPLSDLDHSFRRQEAHLQHEWPVLTENEAIRLQRGFLRYEFCSRSSAITMWNTHITQWDELHIEGYFQTMSKFLQRWEEEEIRCVWAYIHRQYRLLVRELVADFRCDVRRLSRRARLALDSEVVLAPKISNKVHSDFFESWTYNMSCLGLPMLQQLLRSSFNDQRRFLKSTTFELMPKLEETLLLYHENYLGKQWYNGRGLDGNPFSNRPLTSGASVIYKPVAMKLASWTMPDHRIPRRSLDAVEIGLKEIGWVFWEDPTRLKYLGWSGSGKDAASGIKDYIRQLSYGEPPNGFEEDKECPEQSMYITKEDLQGELSAKYAVGPPTPGGEVFFLNRLRDISDFPSKEALPAFQEICQGPPTTG